MQTYYQKHRTIQAFQYNGTIKQLRDELPDLIAGDIIDEIATDIAFSGPGAIAPNPSLQIPFETIARQWSFMTTSRYWPSHKYHYRTNFRYDKQYVTLLNNLQVNDFITVIRNPKWPLWTKLKFYRPDNFKAHWAKQPQPNWPTAQPH